MRLCIVGTGYVGLVSAACFAEMGNDVRCVDVNPDIVTNLTKGVIHIFEPGLDSLVTRNTEQGRLTFTTDLAEGLAGAVAVFICVGTPSRDDGSCDLSHIMTAARDVGRLMTRPLVIIDKSTVPVGTADAVHAVVVEEQDRLGKSIPFNVVSNPEFLKEGDAVNDFMKPDRVIVGTDNAEVADMLRELYAPFARTREKLIVTGVRSAEMIKYAANCLLAAKISFINEIANICEQVGADVRDVRMGIGADHRIGPHFIYPGLGYGGSCFPKDVRALIHTAKDVGVFPELLMAVDAVNNRQKKYMAYKVAEYFEPLGGAAGKTLALWGLAFKARTDDLRESAALTIIKELTDRGMYIKAYDPVAGDKARELLQDNNLVTVVDEQYQALENADALLIATEWNQFRMPDFDRIKESLSLPIIFDGRNLYSAKYLASCGFAYFCIGR
ncbi:MAG: UDP-glucose/GDP-mannose dehydrogenase family protein [Desulfovibrio sp.]|jgi:UDPglucose 6-dehydrogenase|nr:UDP-glucose/GDP-mannose dehydrogenase family protein [Desulfovibrio sp.]